MSVPATNALSPAPRSTSTRTSSSASARSQHANSSSYIANVIALCASGRSNVIHAAGPRTLPLDAHSAAISASENPASRSTSAVCSPSSGAGRRIAPGVSLSFTGMPSVRSCPDRVLDPHLHLARLRVRVLEHLPVVVDRPARDARRRSATRPTRRSTRRQRRLELGDQLRRAAPCGRRWSAKRASSTSSGRPIASHSRCHSRWLLAPTVMCPSRVRSAWYGAVSRCAEPSGSRYPAGAPQLGRLPDRQRQRALEQRGVDPLPAAGPLARHDRAQDRRRRRTAPPTGRRSGSRT